ncbi:MAG: hypothetical protein VKI63_01405, partial [Cyanobium sp.]|nr:hypothetical protein [Cyanobium sp.]
MPPIPPSRRTFGLVATGLLSGMLGVGAHAQSTGVSGATGAASLGTVVNGVANGSCTSGLCTISGGTSAGSNLFHRLSSLNTTGAITGVSLLNGAATNVVVGVTSPTGTIIDKPFLLQNPASMTLMSPGGISILNGSSFTNITQLNLSTATALKVGTSQFDVFNTTSTQATQLTGVIQSGPTSFSGDATALAANGITGAGDVVIDGGLITVENGLLVDSQFGNVVVNLATISAMGNGLGDGGQLRIQAAGSLLVSDSQLLANGLSGLGGTISLLADQISLQNSQLEASGPLGGGVIQVGGGWQGASIGGPNATTTLVDSGTSLIADGLLNGNGGTIVVWSDGYTAFSGHAQARGGSEGGNGGNVEISGKQSLAMGGSVDTRAPNGTWGNLLLDPGNLFVIDGPAGNVFFLSNSDPAFTPTPNAPTGPTVSALVPNNSYITDGQINSLLLSGNITLLADNNIALMDDTIISTALGTPSNLTITATNGDVYLGSSTINLLGGGSISIQATSGQVTTQAVAQTNVGTSATIITPSAGTFTAAGLQLPIVPLGDPTASGVFGTPQISSSLGLINIQAAAVDLTNAVIDTGGFAGAFGSASVILDNTQVTANGITLSSPTGLVDVNASNLTAGSGGITIASAEASSVTNSVLSASGGTIAISSNGATFLAANTVSTSSGGDIQIQGNAIDIFGVKLSASGGSIDIGTTTNTSINISGSIIRTEGLPITIGTPQSTVIIGNPSGAALSTLWPFYSSSFGASNTAVLTQGGALTITAANYAVSANTLLDTSTLYNASGSAIGSTTPGAFNISGVNLNAISITPSGAFCDPNATSSSTSSSSSSSSTSCTQPLILTEVIPDLYELLIQPITLATLTTDAPPSVDGEFVPDEDSQASKESQSGSDQGSTPGQNASPKRGSEPMSQQAINSQIN